LTQSHPLSILWIIHIDCVWQSSISIPAYLKGDTMKRFAAFAIAALLTLGLNLAAGEKGKWTGWLSDAKCAANGARAAHKGCSIKCVEGGQPVVFVQDSDKKVFKLDGADKVKSLIGDKIVLEGALNGETITVSSAAKAE
jgi:hypothetical protein